MEKKTVSNRANKAGAAFNILNLQYEANTDGEVLRQRDEDNRIRQLLRSKNMDMRGNSGYNLVNGGDRVQIDLPIHRVYNPPDAQL